MSDRPEIWMYICDGHIQITAKDIEVSEVKDS
jgi:hypothetical protein